MNKEAYADGLQTRLLQQLFSILIDSGKKFQNIFPQACWSLPLLVAVSISLLAIFFQKEHPQPLPHLSRTIS